MSEKCWFLFGVLNDYNQPDHNLYAWWNKKPSLEMIINAIGGSMENEESVIAAANIYQGKDGRFQEVDFELEERGPGKVS